MSKRDWEKNCKKSDSLSSHGSATFKTDFSQLVGRGDTLFESCTSALEKRGKNSET